MKYYRVKQTNFLWKEGAIISDRDVWNKTDDNGNEYISARIIEHPDNAEFFERVYYTSIKGQIFRTKDQLVEMYEKAFKA